MKRMFLFTFLLVPFLLFAQPEKPAAAQDILKTAYTKAAKEKKKVFIMYHASWCKWCKKLDSALTSTELKPVIEKYFVVAHLDVNERKEKIELLENPGGRELLKQHGGEAQGLPFYVITDAKGKKLTDAKQMPDTSNLGYPAAPEEITLFVKMLKKGNAKISKADAEKISAYLKEHSPIH